MGKKGDKKRLREEENEEEVIEDLELEEELAVLKQIQEERNQQENNNNNNNNNEDNNNNNKKYNYNKEGLLHCIESLGNSNQPFIESMNINDFEIDVQDENDDLEREMAFYNHTLQALQIGRARFAELRIPFNRPDDYFCESLKSDAHMARIKDRLIIEEKRVDAFEKRKQRELNRKFNKQVAELKKTEKSQQVKKDMKDVSQYKDKKREGDREKPQKSFKRQAMDKKYGFGGKERKKAKLTDQKSLNDFSQYSVRGGKLVRREKRTGSSSGGSSFSKGNKGGKGGKNGKGGNRPGKAARMERRAAAKSRS